MYVDFNKKGLKFKVGENVRISKDEQIFAKGHVPSQSEKAFTNQKVKSTVPWTHVISNLNREKIDGTFYKKELQKTNQKVFWVEKVIKRKDNKLYVKWKDNGNSFSSWTDKKEVV